jgi:hypothetical protein
MGGLFGIRSVLHPRASGSSPYPMTRRSSVRTSRPGESISLKFFASPKSDFENRFESAPNFQDRSSSRALTRA